MVVQKETRGRDRTRVKGKEVGREEVFLSSADFSESSHHANFFLNTLGFTSAHSVDPNKPNSSASQLANSTVLLGLHPEMKDHKNCTTKIKAACYMTHVKTHSISGGLPFYHDLWEYRYT